MDYWPKLILFLACAAVSAMIVVDAPRERAVETVEASE